MKVSGFLDDNIGDTEDWDIGETEVFVDDNVGDTEDFLEYFNFENWGC